MAVELLDLDQNELAEDLSANFHVPSFRAQQIVQWVYRRRVRDFQVMTNIALPLRQRLAERYTIFRPSVAEIQLSSDGTRKFLLELQDGSKIETVHIKQPKRFTLCVSSQVGCAIGCRFCRTALMGLKRHLNTHEIIGQVLAVKDYMQENDLAETEDIFTNIVFMGMGEPLHNYDNVTRAVRILNDNLGQNFSARKITVSTSGLVPAIERFGKEGVPANLAISLNATTDEVRTQLIPINKKYPLAMLLETLRNFPIARRKRVTIEYVMLKGVNDSDSDLARLPGLLHGIPCKVNLIPYNANAGLGFFPPAREILQKWQDRLLQSGLNATIRWSKGEDIKAACGQLATAELRAPRPLVQ